MKKGDKLGTLDIYYDDEKIDTIDIILNENPEFDFIKYFKDHLEIPVAFIVIVMLGIVIVFKRRKQYGK